MTMLGDMKGNGWSVVVVLVVLLLLWLALGHTGGSDNASEIDREICTAPSAKAGVNKA